ncbi:MAG: SufE family protein [Pseudomonadales bacterium]
MSETENPFGRTIKAEDIIETLGFFDDWEDRYKYIIDLGKELPAMADELHTEERLIRGCQSKVWIDSAVDGERLQFTMDSDAFIVKGLIAVVLAAYNNATANDIIAFDIDAYFKQLDLMQHLSPTRGNGLQAMVTRIQDIAKSDA